LKFTLGFSPCPNDTFIFDALVHKKIDTGAFDFEIVLEDVETLNEWALEGKLDITKLSFPAFFQSLNQYVLLNSGSALGKGVGPLLVTNKTGKISEEEITNGTVTLPGLNTTANLLFSFAFPESKNKSYRRFDLIEDIVSAGNKHHTTEFGVIIHENRFTYAQKGLNKVVDLGEIWEKKINAPIPLGGIAIKRNIEKNTAIQVDELIKSSLKYAFNHYPEVGDFVKAHSQAMSEDVMRKHIDLYVNNYSLQLGNEGREAIQKLIEVYRRLHEIQITTADDLFVIEAE
jgi:1,4-dihydroxy-6-naphthoate synthase